MADYSVIWDVSETLRQRLTVALSVMVPVPPGVEVHDLVETPANQPELSLFLYEIVEDGSVKNRPNVRTGLAPNVIVRKPPLALKLKYLVTPWSTSRQTDQEMLGRVMQVLYDGAVLTGPQLQGDLANTSTSLKVSLAPLTLEERTRIWHAIQQKYRLSVNYEVRVVNLASRDERTVRAVAERVLDAAVGEDQP
jgi:Pvc16 N-terminal domain